jgi:hypothetical protein
VTLDADSNTEAKAESKSPVSVGGLADVSSADITGTAAHDTEAYVGNDVRLTLAGRLEIDAMATTTAKPSASNNSVSVGVSYSETDVNTVIDSDTVAWIGNGGMIDAVSVKVKAEATHTALAKVDTDGFSGVVSIGDLDAEAKDTGSVNVRIGPSGGGSSGNRSVITTTGAAGIDIDAKLTSSVTSSPSLGSFSLLSGGGTADAIATNEATVTARIGGWANLNAQSGDVDVLADFIGFAKAEAASTSGAGVFALASSKADANFTPDIDFRVGGNADVGASGASGNVNMTARLNHDGSVFLTQEDGKGAIASAKNISGAGLAAVSTANVFADATAILLVDVEPNASLTTGGGDVNVLGLNSNTSLASLNSAGGGLVAVSTGNAKPTAAGSTTVKYRGDVGDGTTGAANNLNVLAEGFTAADGTMSSKNGGAVTVSDGDVISNTNAILTLDFGSSSTDIKVDGSINVTANQSTDSDSKTTATTGGLVTVSNLDTEADATTTVTLNVGAANKIAADGDITIRALHGADAQEISDGTIVSTVGTNPSLGAETAGSTNYVDFGLPHALGTGAKITFEGSGGGLVNEREYTVIVRDANTLHLGGAFSGGAISTLNDTITITRHNFETGDFVYYHANNLSEVSGLDTGKRYKVFVVDENHIKLQEVGQATPSKTVGLGSISGNTVYGGSNSFTDPNAPVTYRVQAPKEFSSLVVDGTLTDNDPFTFVPSDNNRIYIDNHGWSTGQAVIYRADGTPTIQVSGGPALVDSATYYVINADTDYVQLARTQDEATGYWDDHDGDPDTDPIWVPPNPIDLIRGTSEAAQGVLHSLRATNDEPMPGLVDGQSYFAVNRTATSFQLANSPSDSAISFNNGGLTGGSHTFAVEGINLTAAGGAGEHHLVLDIFNGGTGLFNGVGGARGVSGAPSGDQTVTASTTGVAGGLVTVTDGANASADQTVTTNLNMAGGAHLSADNITIETDSKMTVAASADSDSGGFVSIGDGAATATGAHNSTLTIGTNAELTALKDLTMRAKTTSDVDTLATFGSGGFIGTAKGDATSRLTYSTQTLVNGDLTAGGALLIESRTSADAEANSEVDAGGLGADGESDSFAIVGNNNILGTQAQTRTEIRGSADLIGANVTIGAYTDKLRARAFAETDVTAAGADCDAYADTDVNSLNETVLKDNAEITGNEKITVEAEYISIDNTARSDSDLDAVGGDTDSYSSAYLDSRAKIEGHWEALLRTAALEVNAEQTSVTSYATARRDGAWFDGGGSSSPETKNALREIYWESHTIMLGEPNPELEIDENGEIVKLTNIEFLGENAGKVVGDTLTAADPTNPQVILDDIIYDEAGKVTFFANDISGGPNGVIWGNHGLVESQRTWDYVRIINESELDLVINHIDTSDGASVVDIQVDDIPGHTDDPDDNVSLDPDDRTKTATGDPATPTFEFDLNLFYPQTAVEIRNLIAGDNDDSDIILLGGIENTIGSTTIQNQRGNVRVDEPDLVVEQTALIPAIFDEGLIRTNVLDVDASGDIGNQGSSGGRSALMVELIRITHATEVGETLTLEEVHLEADADGDAVLDIALHDRSEDPALEELAVTIDRITAGDDVDVVINDSKAGDNLSEIDGITVQTFNPPDLVNTEARTGEYFTHFSPDGADPYNFIRRTYGPLADEVDSVYTFLEVRAGDDIDIGHVDTNDAYTGAENRTYATTEISEVASPYGSVVNVDPTLPDGADTVIDFIINTDVAWTSGSPPDGTPQIFLTTNGSIVADELIGDMLVGHIHSTEDDVTLNSGSRILDADSAMTVDVSGENITLNSGVVTGETPAPSIGGIGQFDDFLEINVDRNDDSPAGFLDAYDTNASTAHDGIFIDELTGDLTVGTVHTIENVSLRTVGGSILDAEGDDHLDGLYPYADVMGKTIDLDANGSDADIGASDNDLEIDSRRGSAQGLSLNVNDDDDVALEATDDIFLSETDQDLRLVLAHTYTGDIRLTVRESGGTDDITGLEYRDEDLELIDNGSARFAESNDRDPGSQIDADRIIGHGQIFAEHGSVTLIVGDDIETDANSFILADDEIAIFGDEGAVDGVRSGSDPDAGYGTTIILRGQIIANAVVTPGNPIGMAVAYTAGGPGGVMTEIFGNNDVDFIQFGDPTGSTGGTSLNSDGYIFLGSKTRAYGSQAVPAYNATTGKFVSSGDDGEDRFFVYFLQDTTTQTGPNVTTVAEHTLTLDGQADSDVYEVHTLGSNGEDDRNYVINVLDTGEENDDVDELTIFGLNSPNSGLDGNDDPYPTDDIFLMRAAAFLPNETADRPGYVALLHGNLAEYQDVIQNNEDSDEVQRINYDTGLNGRVIVEGQGGNDAFFADDTTVIMSLDGGAGDDQFQIGQIFGEKRNILDGNLLAQDVFPSLVATTRGWLSPGTSAPLIAQGGTGNDEFRVYSNQAELRLEGDDDNDIFIVRAFALAAVADFDFDNSGEIDKADLDAGVAILRDLQDGVITFGDLPNGAALEAALPKDGFGDPIFDTNGDGGINYLDLTLTRGDFTDDVIVLDEEGVASPQIGLGFSVAQAPDIRAGGGQDEVQYNINAPVSVDGGTGFDKLVILGTEFADDIVITKDGIFGAGLNVRYDNVEVVEVDGLEGDDEFFVQSTEFGVAYRVIGGLGSDTINVTGDVTEDIVTRELEGVSGAVDHLVTSGDPLYDGLIVDGFDYNVASADEGIVVIDETNGFTAVREGGPTPVDSYSVRLAKQLQVGEVVYVTVSASRSPQEEMDDLLVNPPPLPNGEGDSIWLSTSTPADINNPLDSEFQRTIILNGVSTQIDSRAVVLTFDHTNWNLAQDVFVFAPDDTRAEGDRVVVVQHSVISNVVEYDAVDVRNVEVKVRDNDTPGVYVLEVEPGTSIEDGRTLVIEGGDFISNPTGLTDEVLVQLAKAPEVGDIIVVKMNLDAEDDAQIKLIDVLSDARYDEAAGTITFDYTNWDDPVRVGIEAHDDFVREDPGTAVISFELDASTVDANGDYVFPNLRSGLGLLDVEVIDNETAGAVTLESGGSTQLIVDDLTTGADETVPDDYTIRLTRRPEVGTTVDVAILTDGLADVVAIDGAAVTYETIGGLRPAQLFTGSIIFEDVALQGTLTRGTGADLGSFIDEGFESGELLRIGGAGVDYDGDYVIDGVTDQTITLTDAFGVAGQVEIMDTVALSDLTTEGIYKGEVTVNTVDRRLIRTDDSSWLADGFLEGQRVRVTNVANMDQFADFKIAIIRGDNETKDEKIEFTAEGALPAWLTGTLDVEVNRIAVIATFTDTDWYVQQEITLEADPVYEVPSTREGVKVFPVSTHLLSKLRGPLAVEGGVTGADRSLSNGLKLPGESDDFLFAIGAQPPESQQIDVLNIFNDSSQAAGTGTMDETTLRGFGMADDLDFSAATGDTFGEPSIFPGGISFGKINFGSGGFSTDSGESTIEVVNLMLGEGNASLDITGTLNPAPFVSATQEFVFTPDGGGDGGTIVREGFDWKAQGFLVGQAVEIEGQIEGQTGLWEVVAIDDAVTPEGQDPNDNSILVLSGPALPVLTGEQTILGIDALVITTEVVNVTQSATGGIVTRSSGSWEEDGFLAGHLITVEMGEDARQYRVLSISDDGLSMELEGEPLDDETGVTKTFWVQGPHGSLTVVHGGGNMLLETTGDMDQTTNMAGNILTRLDGRDWAADGYAVGQRIQISGEANTREILSIVNADPGLEPVDAFGTWGMNSALVLSGPAFTGGQAELTVHVSEALRTELTEAIDIGTNALTRSGGDWVDEGFYVGQVVWFDGVAGGFTVANLSGAVMELQGAALAPANDVAMTVFGYDPTLDDGVRVGGDHITVSGGAGPDSPLVVYGDTSQDGVWYSGHPYDVLGMEFGEKPFDPFPLLPDGENEDDEWVFPLANPFTYAGNDVIDASALFAGVDSVALPTIGFTAYGGKGDDTIIGSQAGDHLAGGSGNDLIMGQRGVDHIYGDSGVNVNILTRALTIDAVDNSPKPTIDLDLIRFINNGTTIEPYASPVADPLTAGRDVIHGDGPGSADGELGDFDDVIFGDHGEIIQNVADPNLPPVLLQKIQTTTLNSILAINSVELQNGDDDVIFGNLDRDIIIGGAGNDMADGDEQDDLIFGDNVFLQRRDGDDGNLVDDITNFRFQTLAGTLLYSRTDQPVPAGFDTPNADNSGELLNDDIARNYRDPDGAPWWTEYLIDYSSQHTFEFDRGEEGVGSFGNDYLAGGEAHDQIFGQLGDDVIQGDGGIEAAFEADSHAGASRTSMGPSDPIGPLTVVASFDALTDGEDYIEGGGGNDVIFGGLGQDDLIGGSSSFFSLGDPTDPTEGANLRPDGDDHIFGGAGTRIDRNNFVGSELGTVDDDDLIALSERHARDADTIAGDNANIVRIVGVNGNDVNPTGDPNSQLYLSFNYDNYDPDMKIIVRGVTMLDYTWGGPDFRPDLFSQEDPMDPAFRDEFGIWAQVDIGGHDEIHGGTGDDTVYTAGGHDRIFGDADDDDLIGGWGNDWISGGTGQDGVIGDDGRIFTSRNTAGDITAFSEPLYAISFLLAEDPDPRHPQRIHGNVISEFVYTPGQVQTATLNVADELKKTVDITPYNLRPNAEGADDPLFDANVTDDIIFGGLGDDFLHGASGDDAIGGGEALEESYTQLFDNQGEVIGLVRTDFTRPWNPGDILKFGDDTDPWNAPKPVQSRLGEFFLYDEYDPRRTILFNNDGSVWKDGDAPDNQYFLNLVSDEGPTELGPVEFAPNGDVIREDYAHTDGDDVIFGDLGNDWQVGGTGRDTIYSGWGNDLANADDVLTTNGNLNDTTDTHPLYEDRVFGGAGLDILIGNTGGDRLIDWVGEYNTYLVPFAPFGIPTVSRQVPPQLFEFLYVLSASDGADPTRATDTGMNEPRNGEPHGELGLIIQRDHGLWQDQTGGPTDPQPGNIPGGPRDVLRSADFNDGQAQGFFIDSGVWQVSGGRLEVAPETLGGDAASVFYVDDWLPSYFEMEATINAGKPTAGFNSNAYLIFDYQNPEDFKFAGVNISIDKIQMGYRDTDGWHVVAQTPSQLKPNKDYDVLLAVNGVTATLVVDNQDVFTYAFAPRVDEYGFSYGLNCGLVGIGSENSKARIDNVAVQILPPEITYEDTEDFTDGTADLFQEQSGDWQIVGDRYDATPAAGGDLAISTTELTIGMSSLLEFDATLSTEVIGGVVFDLYGPEDFKFVTLSAATDQVLIGHFTARHGWEVDTSADWTIDAGTDYDLGLTVKGTTVSVTVDGQAVVGHGFDGLTVDGAFGMLSRDGASSFDSFTVKTNDPAFEPTEGESLLAASVPTDSTELMTDLIYDELDPVIDAAINRWTGSTLFDEAMLSRLNGLTFLIADLAGDALALTVDDAVIVDVDAAGHGWFVDDTPYQDTEFRPQGNDEELAANEASNAYGDMDLLTVVVHELGHVFGYQDMDAENTDTEIMSDTLNEGVRYLPEETFADHAQNNDESLISLDLTPDESLTEDSLAALVDENQWLIKYLVEGAEGADPNGDIAITLPVDDEDGSGDTAATDTESTSDPVADNPGNGKGKKK